MGISRVSVPWCGSTPANGFQWRELTNLNGSHLGFELRCGEETEGECHPETTTTAAVERLDVVLRDVWMPTVTRSDLSTIGPTRPLSGSLSVSADFVDRGGGVQGAELLVDGVVHRRVDVGDLACVKPHVAPVPCPTTGRVMVPVDTRAFADGAHNLELRLVDVAGNRTSVGPVAVVTKNHQSTERRTVPGRVSLRKATLQVVYGARAHLEGSVDGLDDAPLPDAAVEVAWRVNADGTTFTQLETAVTDSSGRFSVPVGPGPSRVYRIRYGASEAIAEVNVRAPLRLRATPSKTRNGRSVKFRGSIPGATAPGVRVELQARAGRKWVPFRTAALRRGRFAASYRFTNTSVRTRYRFRAVVRADPDLPYAPGTSKIVEVLVRP
ncbi:hypothetical protein [Solirubrobacter deserti]|uniref:Carboxypeptidase regulatory-like domain-containing protein n=1 Tax=Solirubrobacter deserti TaxID=2282478 RepID=A0ABT4RKX4_9ACTN|nr:hypothetical protein [Solirubrobacter deserti]MDA0139208.1 hypothetical protein [Solirubrobacter deserti]